MINSVTPEQALKNILAYVREKMKEDAGIIGDQDEVILLNSIDALSTQAAELERVKADNFDLQRIVVDLHWMARRYADGRCTYAPGIVNNAVRKLQAMGVELNICGERTPWARDGMGPGYSGLSEEEYNLGEPVDGWNHIAASEEIKAIVAQHAAEIMVLVGALEQAEMDMGLMLSSVNIGRNDKEYYRPCVDRLKAALSTYQHQATALQQKGVE